MIFHDNCLLADYSHEISFLIFFQKLGKMSQNLSSAAVVNGALQVKIVFIDLTNNADLQGIQSLQKCMFRSLHRIN